MYAKFGALVLPVLMVACATSTARSNAEQALVFSENALPRCEFELVENINATVSVKGDRKVAEEALHRELSRKAVGRGADGVVGIRIQTPERVPFVVRDGRRPTQADLPSVRWNASGQAIRFVDSACRA
jgi:hypothetical protein